MNRRPPLPPQSLSAEERALAKALPRLHGRSEPGPDLDASILAAARAALQPARATRSPARPRIGWIAPVSLAASLLLAVGLVWRLRPLPVAMPVPGSAQSSAQADGAGTKEMPAMRMIEPSAEPQPVPMLQSPALEQAKPAVAPATSISRQQTMEPTDTPAASARESVQVPSLMPNPAPAAPVAHAPPPPPPPAAVSGITATGSQASERAANAGMAEPASAKTLDAFSRDALPAMAGKARMADTAGQSKPDTARPIAAAPEARNEAEMAADSGFVDDPDDSVAPATVDSPTVRDAWLQRIRQLLDQGNVREAKASLAEFRRRYPDAALPASLQVLEIEP